MVTAPTHDITYSVHVDNPSDPPFPQTSIEFRQRILKVQTQMQDTLTQLHSQHLYELFALQHQEALLLDVPALRALPSTQRDEYLQLRRLDGPYAGVPPPLSVWPSLQNSDAVSPMHVLSPPGNENDTPVTPSLSSTAPAPAAANALGHLSNSVTPLASSDAPTASPMQRQRRASHPTPKILSARRDKMEQQQHHQQQQTTMPILTPGTDAATPALVAAPPSGTTFPSISLGGMFPLAASSPSKDPSSGPVTPGRRNSTSAKHSSALTKPPASAASLATTPPGNLVMLSASPSGKGKGNERNSGRTTSGVLVEEPFGSHVSLSQLLTAAASSPTPSMRAEDITTRIKALKAQGLWSNLRLPKAMEPPRMKTHWDLLLDEAAWLANDFDMERKWKMAMAKKLAKAVKKWHEDRALETARGLKTEQLRRKKVAGGVAREVTKYWKHMVQIAQYKQKLRLDHLRRDALERHLDSMVGATETLTAQLSASMRSAAGVQAGEGRGSATKVVVGVSLDGSTPVAGAGAGAGLMQHEKESTPRGENNLPDAGEVAVAMQGVDVESGACLNSPPFAQSSKPTTEPLGDTSTGSHAMLGTDASPPSASVDGGAVSAIPSSTQAPSDAREAAPPAPMATDHDEEHDFLPPQEESDEDIDSEDEPTNSKAEISQLQDDAEISIEELRAMYAKMEEEEEEEKEEEDGEEESEESGSEEEEEGEEEEEQEVAEGVDVGDETLSEAETPLPKRARTETENLGGKQSHEARDKERPEKEAEISHEDINEKIDNQNIALVKEKEEEESEHGATADDADEDNNPVSPVSSLEESSAQ